MVTQGARKQRKGSKEKQNLNKLKEICNKIAACRRGDDWRTAWHLLTTLDAHSLRCNIILQNAAMNACGKCRRWKEAFCILQMSKLSSLPCDVVSYNTMVPLLRWPLALALLFPPRGLRWDIVTFNSLAASSTMPWHQVFTTLQILSKQSVEADPVTYNSAIRASDQWKLSQKLVVSMVKDQLKCDVVTYTSCMTSCRWFISSQWLAHFATRHLDGNLMTFNSMINESTGLWRRASVIFTLIPLQWRLEPDVISHNSVLSCNHDRWPVAMDLFQSMQCDATRPSIITYNTLSGICDRHHFWRLSLALGGLAITQPWYRALSSPSCNELEARSMRCSATINACAQSGWQRAAQLVSKMQTESTEPNIIVYNSFLSSCEKSKGWQNALKTLELLPSPNLVSFNSSLSACEKVEKWQHALSLFALLPVSADVITCNAVLSACEKRRRWQRVLWILRSFNTEWSNTSCNVGIAACQKGLAWMYALRVFWMCRSADAISYSSTLAALSPTQWQLALSLFTEMWRHTLRPGLVACNAVVSVCSRASQWQTTLALIKDATLRRITLDSATWSIAMDSSWLKGPSNITCTILTQSQLQGESSLQWLRHAMA